MKAVDFTTSDRELADVVLRRFGPAEPSALLGWIVMVLARSVREDHAALDLAQLGTSAGGAPDHDGRAALESLRAAPGLCQFLGSSDEVTPAGPPLVVLNERFLYLRRWAVAEWRVSRYVAAARSKALELPTGLTSDDVRLAIAETRDELERRGFADDDLEAVVWRMLTRRISFVTGGPGTGKTWIVTQALRTVARALSRRPAGHPMTYAVAAPTAKAARRLGQTLDANTDGVDLASLERDRDREGSLHHLLGIHPDAVARPRALAHDIVIVDEASMADLAMLDVLLRAASDAVEPCRVVMVGDPHQLASINVGAVLADAVAPEADTGALVTHLRAVHRTESRDILDFAALINAGDGERVRQFLVDGCSDVHRYERFDDPELVALVLDHGRSLVDAGRRGDGSGAVDLLSNLTVLAANREGPGSVAWWNARLRAALRTAEPGSSARFCVGEPVLVTRNQRSLQLHNGDVGVVVDDDGELVVAFDGGRRWSLDAIGHAELAWATTIHKSQGSEYDHVVVVLPRVSSPLLTREILYTGVTRAKRSISLVGELESVSAATNRQIDRVSGLTERLAFSPAIVEVDDRG